MGHFGYGYGWRPYVSVAERRRRAERKLASLRKKGMDIQPVHIDGRKIAKTFWGEAWCSHLESFSDYSNRLPRGRTYVRNGSVCHLAIEKGKVDARVAGSSLYTVQVRIKKLQAAKWGAIKRQSLGKIGSLLELLQGKLSHKVMEVVTNNTQGLFPVPNEISFHCDCPDWAGMCKHIAAVMYGIGSRLDASPALLFTLRDVDHEELIAVDTENAVSAATTASGISKHLADSDLSDVFGIDLDSGDETDSNADLPTATKRKRVRAKKSVVKKARERKTAKRKNVSRTTARTVNNVSAKRKATKKKKKKKKG